MVNLFTVLVFGGIGAIFGPVGFVIGIVIGIIGVTSANSDKAKAKTVASGPSVPPLVNMPTPQSPSIPVPDPSSSQEMRRQEPESSISTKPPQPSSQRPPVPSLEQTREYASCTAHSYAVMLCFYPSNDRSKVNEVTDLLKSDDWVTDKFGVLDELAKRLPQLQAELRDSPMLFQLHSNALVERIQRLPNYMKPCLAMQMDSLMSNFAETDPKDCRDHIAKVLLALRKDSPVASTRLEAEEYILRSGNPAAVDTLKEMRRNPSRYAEMLRSGATGNTVLKTAFGVFAGILAADAVRAAVTDYQVKNLLSQLDQDIAKAGGIDSIPLHDKELASLSNPESDVDSLSSFTGGAEGNTWDDTPAASLPEELDSEPLENSDSDAISEIEVDAGPTIDVADSSDGFSFDFGD